MPRTARIVVPGVAHHVTQRGNRRLRTFFEPADYRRYLGLLDEACGLARVGIVSYCLMPNHVHLVLLPSDGTGRLGQDLAPRRRGQPPRGLRAEAPVGSRRARAASRWIG